MFKTSTYLERAPRLGTVPAPGLGPGGPPAIGGVPPEEGGPRATAGGPAAGDPLAAGAPGVTVRDMGGGGNGSALLDVSDPPFLFTQRFCSLSK